MKRDSFEKRPSTNILRSFECKLRRLAELAYFFCFGVLKKETRATLVEIARTHDGKKRIVRAPVGGLHCLQEVRDHGTISVWITVEVFQSCDSNPPKN